MSEDNAAGKRKWFPLESNPGLMNTYLQRLGADTSKYQYCDVYGVDDELLSMVPTPVLSVMLLFPISAASEAHLAEEAAAVRAAVGTPEAVELPAELYYTQQTVSNACGTVALIHAVANNRDLIPVEEGKFFADFFAETANLTPLERARALERNDAISEQHDAVATSAEAQSAVNEEIAENVDLHFITFVTVGGKLWELDGRKATPICHGASSRETLLTDAANVIKQFMARDPNELRFTMAALAPAQEE